MKKPNTSKILVFALALALLIGTALAIGISAEDTVTEPKIIAQNIRYQGDFALMFAIDASTVTSGSVTLELYDHKPVSSSVPIAIYTADTVTAPEGNLTVDSYIVTTKGIAAVDMAKQYYVKAFDGDKESAVMRYSVAEYLYERLADSTSTAEQKALYNAVINLGDCAQVVITPDVNETPVSDYRLVTIEDGCAINDYSQGVYALGDTLTPVAAGGSIDKWTVVTYNDDGTSSSKFINAGESFTVEGRTEVYYGVFQTQKAGTIDFEDYTVGGELPKASILDGDKGYSASIAQDTVYGRLSTVLKTNISSTGSSSGMAALHVMNSEEANVTAEEATAYEFSFDIKFDYINAADNEKGRNFRIYFNNSAGKSPVNFFINVKNGRYYLRETLDASTYDVDLGAINEYHNLRFKVEVNDDTSLNIYTYVDGSDTPVVSYLNIAQTVISSLSDFTKCQFTGYQTLQEAAIINFDNIYCGYIKE